MDQCHEAEWLPHCSNPTASQCTKHYETTSRPTHKHRHPDYTFAPTPVPTDRKAIHLINLTDPPTKARKPRTKNPTHANDKRPGETHQPTFTPR